MGTDKDNTEQPDEYACFIDENIIDIVKSDVKSLLYKSLDVARNALYDGVDNVASIQCYIDVFDIVQRDWDISADDYFEIKDRAYNACLAVKYAEKFLKKNGSADLEPLLASKSVFLSLKKEYVEGKDYLCGYGYLFGEVLTYIVAGAYYHDNKVGCLDEGRLANSLIGFFCLLWILENHKKSKH